MRLLDRYLLRELMVPLAYCFSGFLTFWVAFDLYNELQTLQRLTLGEVARCYALQLPGMLFTALPVGLLLALLYALTNHSRYNELVAIRAAGVSLGRITAPYVLVGFFCSVSLFLINDVWLHDSTERAERIKHKHLFAVNEWHLAVNLHNELDQRIWTIGGYHSQAGVMTNVLIEWNLPGGGHRTVHAQMGMWTNNNWLFRQVSHFTYLGRDDVPPEYKTNELVIEELTERPRTFDNEIEIRALDKKKAGKRPMLSLAKIMGYIALHPDLSGDMRALMYTQFHARLAEPWKCLVVVFIAIPFAVGSGRRNVFVGVASSIFICFFFVVLSQFSLALGTSGRLPPWLAAWLPNLVFGISGLAMMYRVR